MTSARRNRPAEIADVGLRSPPRKLDARPDGPDAHLPRAGRETRGIREADGLHPHRVDAGDGASILRIVGLPGDRLFRAHLALRHSGRFPVLRGCLPPGGHRRDRRLGARALPEGRARAGLLRRHRALRTRRPAQGRAARLGHAHLQLRPQRSPRLPDLQRPVLAARSSTSTACAWMPSRRCSISITRARPASGSRISTAATRTWKPSISCAASTNWRTASRARSPSPRNPPPSRASPGRST